MILEYSKANLLQKIDEKEPAKSRTCEAHDLLI